MSKPINKELFRLTITDTNAFKIIIDTLSKIVSETVFIIKKPQKEENKKKTFTGLEINTIEPARTAFVKIQIPKKYFTEFKSTKEKYQIGINLVKLTKMIKYIENDDIIILSLYENDIQNIVMEFQKSNTNNKKKIKLALIDLDYTDKQFKKIDYEKIISFCPLIYKKIFRELDDYQSIKISCSNEKILFTYKDQMSEIIDEYTLNEGGLDIISNSKDNVSGIFPLQFIILFAKCASLCEQVKLNIKNDHELLLIYPTKSFGIIKVVISPVNEDNIKNVDYDYSDDEDELDVIGNDTNKLYYDD
jgi:proliferating cell nuclear antigen PCNA